MRAMAKLTGFLAMLFLGMFIGGLIVGNRAVWIWGLVLFVLDIIVGPMFQSAADRRDGLYHTLSQLQGEEDIERRETLEMRLHEKSVHAAPKYRPSQNELIERHRENYFRIKNRDKSFIEIENINQDASGRLLLDVCASMQYAPRKYDFYYVHGVCALEIAEAPALWYAIQLKNAGAILYTSLFLVHTQDKLRLFSVEVGGRSIFLCEFAEGRHINYGNVHLLEAHEKIAEILYNERRSLNEDTE